jgi:hypothetical protein
MDDDHSLIDTWDDIKVRRHTRLSRAELRAKEKVQSEITRHIHKYEAMKRRMKMAENNVKQFVQGIKITKKDSKYGSFYKVGININDFCDKNPMNDKGWVNFNIFENKEGIPYAVIDTYGTESNNIVKIAEINEDEIPF